MMRTFQLEYTREASTMKQKIVIITSKYLHPFVEKAFEDFKIQVELNVDEDEVVFELN